MIKSGSISSGNSSKRGFTLPEVLMAILILATVLVGLLQLMVVQTRTLSVLEQRTFARIVADNIMTQTMIDNDLYKTGISRGAVFLANENWSWKREILKTEQLDLMQIDISVTMQNRDQELARLVSRRSVKR